MDQSQSDPVLSVTEHEHGASGYTGESPARSVILAGALARELLATRSLDKSEEAVLRAMLAGTGLAWGAIYRASDEVYRLSAVAHPSTDKLPKTLDNHAAHGLLEGVRRVGAVGAKDLPQRLKGTALIVRLDSEFSTHPALLLVGSSDAGARSAVKLRAAEAIAEVASTGLMNVELLERLQSEVFIDFLTHCYNRRAFEEHLNVELVRARRYERPLCLLLIDLDDFKEINDVLGHQAGDYVLERIGETLRSAFRTTDRVCRYGGDEFAVIFPETPKDEVLRLAERLRRNISTLFPDATIPSGITSSIGVASFPLDGTRVEDLVKAADQAMYRAKEAGRNKVLPA